MIMAQHKIYTWTLSGGRNKRRQRQCIFVAFISLVALGVHPPASELSPQPNSQYSPFSTHIPPHKHPRESTSTYRTKTHWPTLQTTYKCFLWHR